MKCALLALALIACATPRASVQPFPALPDTLYAASGPVPVLVVDAIQTPDSNQLVIGRFEFSNRRVLVWSGIADPRARRKVLEHERCHITLLDSGLHNHFREVPWLVELICDAFATARMAELEGERR